MDLSGLKFGSSSNYTILSEIGRGGMGIVFLAEKDSEGVVDLVALKTIRTKSADQETRLKGEANIATGLRHENIVKTYGLESIPYSRLPPDFLKEFDNLTFESARRVMLRRVAPGDRFEAMRTRIRVAREAAAMDEKRLFLMVMDYIEGTDVRAFHQAHVSQKLLIPVPLAAFIVSRVARSLAYAHQFIIHRDISPENMLLNVQGVVKLSDFGVAVSERTEGISGKLSYLSPEQILGQAVDARTDLYSLGLTLYLLLTGVPLQRVPSRLAPAQGVEYVRKLLERPVAAPSMVRTDVPPELSGICMNLLAMDRNLRYARSEDVARDLEQKYLYARGFGPTNNSMQAYLEIFDSGFKEATNEQVRQLPFLQGQIQRPLTSTFYTAAGRKLLEETLGR